MLAGSAVLATVLAVQARRAEDRAEAALVEAKANEAEAIAQSVVAEQERRRAEEERRSSDAVREFLQTDLLGQAAEVNQAETSRQEGEGFEVQLDPTVGELLDRAAERLGPERIDARFPGLPLVQADILRTVGDTYMLIGRQERKAVDFLERAVRLHTEAGVADEPRGLAARSSLAKAYAIVGRYKETLELLEPLIAARSRVLGIHHPDTINSQDLRGVLLLHLGRAGEAVDYYRPIVESARKHLGADHVQSLWVAGNYAAALGKMGRVDEAFEEANQVIAMIERLNISFDHPGVEAAYGLLATLYEESGRHDEAIRVFSDALAKAESAGHGRHPSTWYYRHTVATDHIQHGRFEAAAALFERNQEIGLRDLRHSRTLEGLAQCRVNSKRFEDAEALYREALQTDLEHQGPGSQGWWPGKLRFGIAKCLIEQGKLAEAEPFLIEAHRDFVVGLDRHTQWSMGLLIQTEDALLTLYRTLGREDDVAKWTQVGLDRMTRLFDETRRSETASLFEKLKCAEGLGNALAAAGRKEPVIPIFEQSLELIREAGYPVDSDALYAYERLRLAVSLAGRHDLAAGLAAEVVDRLRERPETPREVLSREVFALGAHLLWSRKRKEAEDLLRESVAMQAEIDPASWEMTKRRFFLGTDLLWLKKYDEAEALLLESHEQAVARIAMAPEWEKHYPAHTAKRLVELYTALGRPEDVEKWRAKETASRGGK